MHFDSSCGIFAFFVNPYFSVAFSTPLALGEEQGRMQGELRYNSLIKLLLDAGRMDDLKKVLSDENYRKKLFEEFQL